MAPATATCSHAMLLKRLQTVKFYIHGPLWTTHGRSLHRSSIMTGSCALFSAKASSDLFLVTAVYLYIELQFSGSFVLARLSNVATKGGHASLIAAARCVVSCFCIHS